MATRVLVTLQPDADVAGLITRLSAIGGAEIQPPQPELPGVCLATVDEQTIAADTWAHRAASVPGVANAEVDQLRWNM